VTIPNLSLVFGAGDHRVSLGLGPSLCSAIWCSSLTLAY
jgi:hypothetical protein